MAITAHWINSNWDLQGTVLDFLRFGKLHTGEAVATLIFEVVQRWNLFAKVSTITTDNVADMCNGIGTLRRKLIASTNAPRTIETFHVRCIVHIINLEVKKCFALIHD